MRARIGFGARSKCARRRSRSCARCGLRAARRITTSERWSMCGSPADGARARYERASRTSMSGRCTDIAKRSRFSRRRDRMRLTVLSVAYPLAPVTRDTAGGAEQILSLIDDAIVAAGHHSIVIACDGSAVRGDLIATPRERGALDANARAAAWRRLRELVAKVIGDVDVVHYHGFDFAAYDVQSATPRIATLHLAPSLYPQSV